MKDKMRQARDNSQVKAKVKTVNKMYKKASSSVRQSRLGSSMNKEKPKKE